MKESLVPGDIDVAGGVVAGGVVVARGAAGVVVVAVGVAGFAGAAGAHAASAAARRIARVRHARISFVLDIFLTTSNNLFTLRLQNGLD